MKASDRGYFTPLSFDLRVRERMLAAGVVTPTDVQQYLAGLPDHESQCETLGIPQPAFTTPQPPAPAPAPAPIRVAAPAPAALVHADVDDDDEDEDEDDEEEVAAVVKPAEVVAAPAAPVEVEAAPVQTIAVGEPNPAGSAGETTHAAAIAEEVPAEAAPVEAAPPAPEPAEQTSTTETTNQATEEHAG